MKKTTGGLFLILWFISISLNSYAALILDGTLGRGGQILGPNYSITPDLGRQVGSNLFHSFNTFNLSSGESATFYGPAGIQNILTRVTGGSSSLINGTIRSDISRANMFILNPAGILIGKDARIDVSGSFHISTADYLKLGDGGRFNATEPSSSILTSAPPSAFGFIGGTKGNIILDNSSILMPEGSSLSISGGDVSIINSNILVPSGSIYVSALKKGEVPLTVADLKPTNLLGNISISDNRPLSLRPFFEGTKIAMGNLDISGIMPGSIALLAERVNLNSAMLQSINIGPFDAGGITILAAQEVKMMNDSSLILSSLGYGKSAYLLLHAPLITIEKSFINSYIFDGSAGQIVLEGRDIKILNGGALSTSSLGSCTGGDIYINAEGIFSISGEGSIVYSRTKAEGKGGAVFVKANNFTLDDRASILSSTDEHIAGSGGDIHVDSYTIDMSGGSSIYTSAYGQGRGGAIIIRADHSIDLRDSMTGFFSLSYAEGDSGGIYITSPKIMMDNQSVIGSTIQGSGNSGDTLITANMLTIQRGSYIDSSTLGRGRGGNITLRISEYLRISNSLPFGISAVSAAEGNAGVIDIDARHLILDNSVISTTSAGSGNGGTINIKTSDLLITNNGYIDSSSFGSGNGGQINIQSSNAININGIESGVHAMSSGIGRAGDIYMDSNLLNIHGSVILTNSNGSGKGGNIRLHIQSLNLSGNALISSESTGSGNAGNIYIDAGLLNSNYGKIRTSSLYSTGGNINIRAGTVQLRDRSSVTATVASGEGSGGNVEINSEALFTAQNSSITARADQGYGGNISINSKAVILSRDSILDASSNITGREGTVSINAPTVDVAGNMAILSSSFLDIEGLKPRLCSNKAEDISTFIIGGREGLPPTP